MIALYFRSSVGSQAHASKKNSFSLRLFVSRRASGKRKVAEFVDERLGLEVDKPQLQKLMEKIKKGLVHSVVTSDWSRVSTLRSDHIKFKEVCAANNVELWILHQSRLKPVLRSTVDLIDATKLD